MITEVPSAGDFKASGVELLNVAWGLVLELYYRLAEAGSFEVDPDPEQSEEYWETARRTVATALVLTHQASDTLLQAKIAESSPFLLVTGSARDWPKKCEKNDTPFSAFRTHDSQDLPRVHDTVAATRLPEEYRSLLGELREARNRAVHTVDPNLEVDPVQVLRYILAIAKETVDGSSWVDLRRDYLDGYPLSVLHSSDHVYEWQLPFEITTAVDRLGAGEVQQFFNLDKKQRRYLCLSCSHEENWFTTVLGPNEPDSCTVACFVCRGEADVVREDCGMEDCRGNVIQDGCCLSCGRDVREG